jgi:hypothetical protein
VDTCRVSSTRDAGWGSEDEQPSGRASSDTRARYLFMSFSF